MKQTLKTQRQSNKRAGTDPDTASLILDVRRESQLSDPERTGEAFDTLLSRYMPLIEKTVSHFAGDAFPESDRDDLRQEAIMRFYHAILRYDLSQEKVSFGLYAQVCITNRLISCLRALKRREQEKPLSLESEEFSDYPDETEDPPGLRLMQEESFRNTCEVIRKTLSPFEYDVWGYYVKGASASEIAAAVGKNEKAVTNAIGRIRKKLRAVRSEFDF